MDENDLWVFNHKLKVRDLAKEVVEEEFPEEHYGDMFVYEAWSLRRIMENLIEIALRKNEKKEK